MENFKVYDMDNGNKEDALEIPALYAEDAISSWFDNVDQTEYFSEGDTDIARMGVIFPNGNERFYSVSVDWYPHFHSSVLSEK